MKHTPGPWTYAAWKKDQEPYNGCVYYEADDGAIDICHIIVDGRNPAAAKADGELIAKAPEMAALLEECKDTISSIHDYCKHFMASGRYEQELLARMESVLTKLS